MLRLSSYTRLVTIRETSPAGVRYESQPGRGYLTNYWQIFRPASFVRSFVTIARRDGEHGGDAREAERPEDIDDTVTWSDDGRRVVKINRKYCNTTLRN